MTNKTATESASDISLAAFITERQQALDITDHDLAYAAGYTQTNVIAQIKAGRINLPFNKVNVIAELLRVSRLHLLGHVLAKNNPDLWSLLEELLPLGEVSATEVNLIRHLRGLPGADRASPMVLGGAGVVALVMPGWGRL